MGEEKKTKPSQRWNQMYSMFRIWGNEKDPAKKMEEGWSERREKSRPGAILESQVNKVLEEETQKE